jgi:hypothetical protein
MAMTVKRVLFCAALFVHTPYMRVWAHLDFPEAILMEGLTASQRVRMGSDTHTYESVPGWCRLPVGIQQLGNTHGNIVIDAAGSVYFNTDTARSIMVYRPDGSYMRAFGQETVGIHDMFLRREQGVEYLYAAHLAGSQVVKYTLTGEIVWTLPWPRTSGKYETASQYKPTSVTVGPDGSIYVADGYGQHWIHIYRPDRTYVRSFGGKGELPGQFNTCHGLRVDVRTMPPTLVVCDRENRRLQRFSLEGEFMEVLATGLRRPCHVDFHGDLTVVAELEARVTILDRDFRVVTHLGDNPDRSQWARNPVAPEFWQEGIFTAPHGVCFDERGNLYVMDWNRSGRISKLQKGRRPF